MDSAKPIRDPVHNYISLTSLEKAIIDTPDFQRLRFVLQNSTAYLTYPNANNCRFLHSLGVMHLSGRFFIHALKNSSSEDLISLLLALDNLVKVGEFGNRKNIMFNSWKKSIGNSSRFLHNPISGNPISYDKEKGSGKFLVYEDSPNSKKYELAYDPLFLINTFWQTLRVVGLVHDLGHLPMSHLFENAITRFDDSLSDKDNDFSIEIITKTKEHLEKIDGLEKSELTRGRGAEEDPPAIHELRGLFIFSSLEIGSTYDKFQELVFSLSRKILTHDPEIYKEEEDNDKKVLRALHRIVAGEIDADRLDYCVRDPEASGLEFGSIDVERLVTNMSLCKNEEGQFFFLPSFKAISAVESFFHQRYLLYKYEIYHHNVARFDGLLEEILVWLLNQAYSDASVSRNLIYLLDNACFVKQDASKNNGYRFMPDKYSPIYDDSWLRSVLSETYILLSNDEDLDNNPEVARICLLLETFLYRKTNNILSFWKRDSDIDYLFEDLNVDVQKVYDLRPFTISHEKIRKKTIFEKFISELKASLGDDYIVILKKLKPKIHKRGDLSSSILTNNSIKRVEEVSRYVDSLNYAIECTADIHISVVHKDIKLDSLKLESTFASFKSNLVNYIEDLSENM